MTDIEKAAREKEILDKLNGMINTSITKSETPSDEKKDNIEKGVNEGEKNKEIDFVSKEDLQKSILDEMGVNNDLLLKAIGSALSPTLSLVAKLSEKVESLEKGITAMGNKADPLKSFQNLNFLEKAVNKEEQIDGKAILVQAHQGHRDQISNMLSKAFDESTDSFEKGVIGNDILNFQSGCPLSVEGRDILSKKNNVKIV